MSYCVVIKIRGKELDQLRRGIPRRSRREDAVSAVGGPFWHLSGDRHKDRWAGGIEPPNGGIKNHPAALI
jgi:hypothetical protein